MFDIYYPIVFERGIMPFISIITAIVAFVLMIVIKPTSVRTFSLKLFFSLLPFLAGVIGYYILLQSVTVAIEDFMAMYASDPELVQVAKEELIAGKQTALDPLFLGLLLSVPLVLLNVLIFLLTRKQYESRTPA